jgi:Fe2+ transport system protein B
MTLDTLVTVAGCLHLLQLPSMLVARRAMNWQAELAALSGLSRRLIVVFGAGIIACVIGTGCVVVACHGHVLQECTGRALCLFLAAFWLGRGAVQVSVFGGLWPRSLHWMHLALTGFYPALGLAYAAAVAAYWAT